MGDVRAIAVAVLRHPQTGALLVDEIVEPSTGRTFHRLPGGGIEFGEWAHATVARELREEYDLAVSVGDQLGVLESLFTYEGQAGHEIVLVYAADPVDAADWAFERRPSRDADGITATWRSPTDATLPLYPDGAAELVGAVQ